MWLSVWSEVQIVCMWSSWCHCHPRIPSSLASFKSRHGLPFWYQLNQVFLEKSHQTVVVVIVIVGVIISLINKVLVIVIIMTVCVVRSKNLGYRAYPGMKLVCRWVVVFNAASRLVPVVAGKHAWTETNVLGSSDPFSTARHWSRRYCTVVTVYSYMRSVTWKLDIPVSEFRNSCWGT